MPLRRVRDALQERTEITGRIPLELADQLLAPSRTVELHGALQLLVGSSHGHIDDRRSREKRTLGRWTAHIEVDGPSRHGRGTSIRPCRGSTGHGHIGGDELGVGALDVEGDDDTSKQAGPDTTNYAWSAGHSTD